MFERTLTKIFGEVLRLDTVDPDDDFFERGGSSLHAVELSRRIYEQLGLELQIIDVFRNPSVRALDTVLAGLPRAPATPVTPREPLPSHPVSPIQRSLFLLDRMTPRADARVVPVLIELEAELEPELAKAAYLRVLERHEILRTTFTMEDGDPAQHVLPASSMASGFEHTDLRAHAEPMRGLQARYAAAASEAFDLEHGPLVRFELVELAERRCVGLLSIHHILSDGFSAATFEHELRWAHDDCAGRPLLADGLAPPPALSFHYKDYVYWLDEWLAGPLAARAQSYWSGVLAGHVPSLHFGEPPAGASFAAAMEERPLDAATLDTLHRLSERLEVTLFVVLQCCIRALLRQRSSRSDTVLGVAVTTRDVVPSSGQIGPYVNTLPLRAYVPSGASFGQLTAVVDEAMLAGLAHKLLPLELIGEQLTGGAPLFDVGFTMQPRASAGRYARVEPPSRSDPLGIALLFIAYESPSGLDLRVRYRVDIVSRVEVLELHEALVRVIHAVGEHPDEPLDAVLGPPPTAGRFIELDLD